MDEPIPGFKHDPYFKINGATNGTRTRNPENHNLVLWPIEL